VRGRIHSEAASGGELMYRAEKYLTSVILSAALMAPLTISTTVFAQEDRDHERHEQEQRNQRVYDPVYRDYHTWNHSEDQEYRKWLDDRHERYRAYDQLNADQQQEYWRWRHEHEKHEDRDRDHH
jgi:hypothetical protein